MPQSSHAIGVSPCQLSSLFRESLKMVPWVIYHAVRGGSTGSRTGCNLKTGWCCMIAFPSCLNFALHILMPILWPRLSLPTLVPQGYSALFGSILSGESKELVTTVTMKARGYSGEKASGMISILGLYRHVIISFMTFWPNLVMYGLCSWEMNYGFPPEIILKV